MEEQSAQPQKEIAKSKADCREALQELEEIEWRVSSERNERMEILEGEAKKTKESERRMLEMLGRLALQTQQNEQINKILQEDVKIEKKSLKEYGIKIMQRRLVGRGAFKTLEKSVSSMDAASHPRDELSLLRDELGLALDAEDKNRKALDDLALALQEVTLDSISAKQQLCNAESDLASSKEEIEQLRDALKQAKVDLALASDENKRLRSEAEELLSYWAEKEKGFTKCMKMCEEEVSNSCKENSRLLESQRAAKKEISKLKDLVKQAENGAMMANGTLEIARRDKSQSNGSSMPDKETLEYELQCVKKELECARASEAAALDSVKKLQSLLVEKASSMEVISKESSGGAHDHHGGQTAMAPSSLRPPSYDSEKFQMQHNNSEDDQMQEHALAATTSMARSVGRTNEKTKRVGGFGGGGGVGVVEQRQNDGKERDRFKSAMRQKRRRLFRRFSEVILLRRTSSHK